MSQTKQMPKDPLGAFIGCGCATGLACAIVISAPVSIPTVGVVALIAGSAVAGAVVGSFVPATSMIPKAEANSPQNFPRFNIPFDKINFRGFGSLEMPTAEGIWNALSKSDPSKFWNKK
jgi:hypothetical protein